MSGTTILAGDIGTRDQELDPAAADDRPPEPLLPDSAHRSIGTQIAVVARQLRQCFDERVEAMGVTRAKFLLIGTVSRHPGVTQRAIAQKLQVTDVTAGRLIDRVSADGLIERRENPDDRRAYCIYLTPAARPVLDALGETVARFEADLFKDFDADETAALNRLLARLSSNLDCARESGPRRNGTAG